MNHQEIKFGYTLGDPVEMDCECIHGCFPSEGVCLDDCICDKHNEEPKVDLRQPTRYVLSKKRGGGFVLKKIDKK